MTREAKARGWSMRYGRDGKPSREDWDRRARIVVGVAYAGGTAGEGAIKGTSLTRFMKSLNSAMCSCGLSVCESSRGMVIKGCTHD